MNADRRTMVRTAYERARWWRGLPWAIPVLLLAAAAWTWGSASALFVGPLLAVALVVLRWMGQDRARGAVSGLLAGTVPYLVMIGWRCTGSCSPAHCAMIGVVSGLAAGIVLSRGLRSQSMGWAVSAVSVAAGTSALSCLALGAPGLLVLPALLAASMVPATVLRRA